MKAKKTNNIEFVYSFGKMRFRKYSDYLNYRLRLANGRRLNGKD